MMIMIHLDIDICIAVLETVQTPIIFPYIVGGAILPNRVKVIAKTGSEIHKLTFLGIRIKITIHQAALNLPQLPGKKAKHPKRKQDRNRQKNHEW